MLLHKIRFLFFFCLLTSEAYAQRPLPGQVPTGPSDPTKRVDLKADSVSMSISAVDGSAIRDFWFHVRFKQEDMILTCNHAIFNETTGIMEAYGKVKILKGDSITVLSDTALYFSQTKQSKLNGKVSMNDKVMTLTTKTLDYDMANGLAFYTQNGKIVDKENTLTSKEGYYNTRTKFFKYVGNVKLVGKTENKKPFNLKADSLRYNTQTKMTYFIAPTTVTSDNDVSLAKSGLYDTKNKALFLTGRSTAKNDEYFMVADTLYYDRITEKGTLIGKAEMVSRKDSAVITGQHVDYSGKEGRSKVYGNAILRNKIKTDTLYIKADTLLSLENKATKLRKLFAFKHVLIYKRDMQGKCDSLIYNTEDSTISFFQKPILWNDGNQSEADSIWVQMANSKIQLMNLRGKSFIVSKDSLQQFNQIKGRKITATFSKDAKLDKVRVEGNGESVYFALGDKNKLEGMNRVQCSKINLNFENSKIKRIAFVGKPDSQFYPPKLINEENKNLTGFFWRITEKPTKNQVLGLEILPSSNTKDRNKTSKTLSTKEPAPMTAKPSYKN